MDIKATALRVNTLTQSNMVTLTRSLARLANNCIPVAVFRIYNSQTGYATALLYNTKSLVQGFCYMMAEGEFQDTVSIEFVLSLLDFGGGDMLAKEQRRQGSQHDAALCPAACKDRAN
jgi:hypothetical protein